LFKLSTPAGWTFPSFLSRIPGIPSNFAIFIVAIRAREGQGKRRGAIIHRPSLKLALYGLICGRFSDGISGDYIHRNSPFVNAVLVRVYRGGFSEVREVRGKSKKGVLVNAV